MSNEDMTKIWKRLVSRAWMDEDFKARLLKDPGAVMKEQGMTLPSGKKVRVVEAAADETVIVLPSMPAPGRAQEDDERLAALFR